MSVNLIIDIGNSLLKVALVQRDEVLEQHSCQSLSEDMVSDIKARYPSVSRAIVASTAHSTAEVASLLRKCGVEVLEMNSLTPIPIGNDYLSPETLGVDRLAAAVGAVEVMGCADALIVDFGTAITTGNASEQQQVFQIIEVCVMSDGVAKINSDRAVNL